MLDNNTQREFLDDLIAEDSIYLAIISGDISFEQLSGLSVPQFRMVIGAPNSAPSQEILNPPPSRYRPGYF